MTRLHSPTFFKHLKALFRAGTLSGLGEGELLERFLSKHDEAAFEEILARHGPTVLGSCRRWLEDPDDVDDAFQAVFLILVQKAATVRSRNSLSSWLYSVSLKVAKRARANKARRHSRERPVAAEVLAVAQEPEKRQLDRDTLLILDEEIHRLPEKQQAAIVLCLVQGKTHEVAAAELGCPLGTIKSRIAGGRATLARKLARRGLAPSIALGASSISENLVARSIPHDLVRQMLEAATRFAVSRSIRGATIAASVQNLMHGVLSTMRLARMKSIGLGFAVAAVFVGISAALVVAQTGRARDADHLEPVADGRPSSTPARLDLYGDPLPAAATMRFGTIRHRQGSPIHRIRYSTDGKFVVTDGDDRRMRLWDSQDGRLTREVDVRLDAIRDFVVSADRQMLVAVGVELDRRQGTEKHKVTYTELATGKRVATEDWDLPTDVSAGAFSPDGRTLAIGNTGGTVRILDAQKRVGLCDFEIGKRQLTQIAFASAGKRIAALSCDPGHEPDRYHLNIFDLDRRRELRAFPKLPVIKDLAFSPDGTLVAAAHSGGVMLWDIETGQLKQFADWFEKLAISADGRRMAGVDGQGAITRWDLTTRIQIDTSKSRTSQGNALALSPDGLTIASNGGSQVLHYLDLPSYRDRIEVPDAHLGYVDAILLSSDGKTLISASEDGTVRLWDPTSGKQRAVLNHAGKPQAIALSSDNRFLLVGTLLWSRVYIWDLANTDKPTILHSGFLTDAFPIAVCFSGEDGSIQTFWSDGGIRCWDGKTDEPRKVPQPRFARMSDHFAPPAADLAFTSATFFANGKLLAAIETTHGLHVIDLATGKERYQVTKAMAAVPSPDQQTLAIAMEGMEGDAPTRKIYDEEGRKTISRVASGTIVLVAAESGKQTLQIDVSGSEVWSLAFSPDGKTLAATTGWQTGRIHLYEVATGKEFRTIETPAIRTSGLTFTPDGSQLICGMADTSVLVWDLQPKP